MTLHLHLPGGAHHRSHEQQQEIRDARRLLKEKIRNDWEYPTLPEHQSSGRRQAEADVALERIAGFRIHASADQEETHGLTGEIFGLGFKPVEWRERGYSSVSEIDEESGAPTATAKDKRDVYRFDGPDSVGVQLSQRREARKRKRQERLEAEMEWNNGLAHWTRRRDAWCRAHTSAQVHMLDSQASEEEAGPTDSASSLTSTTSSSPRTSTSSTGEHTSTPATSPATTPDLLHLSTRAVSPYETLLPVAPAILPDHPVRRRITTHMYPEIYSKIILQSRTPSVPINLLTLIRALVQGWKEDGEWPPKTGPAEKSIGRRKGSHVEGSIKQGVKAVGRALHLTGSSERR